MLTKLGIHTTFFIRWVKFTRNKVLVEDKHNFSHFHLLSVVLFLRVPAIHNKV